MRERKIDEETLDQEISDGQTGQAERGLDTQCNYLLLCYSAAICTNGLTLEYFEL